MFSNVTTIITFIALIYYTVLLFIILGQKIRSRVTLFFSLYLLSMMLWSFTGFMIFSGVKFSPAMDTLFWNRILVLGSIAMPVAFFSFVEAFLMLNHRPWLYVAWVIYLATQVGNLFGLVVTGAHVSNGQLFNEYGPVEPLAAVFWAFLFGFSAFDLIGAYRKSRDYLFRNRLNYLFLVVVVIFAGSLTNLTDLQHYPGDIVFNILAAFLITVAILRHRLLDFSLVLRKGLLYVIPTLIIGISYYLVILIALNFLTVGGVSVFLLTLLVAVLSALTVKPLQDLAQNWIDRIFFREKHDANLMLQRISHTAAYVLDIDEITQMILDEITSSLHIDQAAFFLKHSENDEFYLASSKGLGEKVDIHWDSSHPIVGSLSNFDHALTRHDLNVMPQFRSLWGEDRQVLEKIWAELLIPLKVKGELMGFFTVGPKSSKETYTDDDQLTLMTLANQMAFAIENAHLYSAEQSRREELDTLYHISRQLVAIDEVDEVLQTTIQYMVKSVHVTFARALLLDDNKEFTCRAAFPIRPLNLDLGEGRVDPPEANQIYLKAITRQEPTLLSFSDPSLTNEERHALLLDQVTSLCLSPLQVSDQAFGLIILGERRDVLRDSFDKDKLRLIGSISDQAASALRRANLHEQMEHNFLETVLALANAMDARDSYTINHSQRMASIAEAICLEMGRSEEEIKAIHWAALLHDMGKIGVPDSILLKPGPLTEEEWVIMKKHPEIGARIVAPVKKLGNVSPIIRGHQERFDGSGYPDGLKGEQIPFGARLLAIVDSYGAMTDERAYRKTRTPQEAFQELIRCKGTQFDPDLVDLLIVILEKLSTSSDIMNYRLNTPAR